MNLNCAILHADPEIAVANIQYDLAVSANKRGVLVEPMAYFRARRKRTSD